MGRRGGLGLVLVGALAAGCTTTVDGSRAAAAPARPVTIARLTTDPCAALYPDQVRAIGLGAPGTTVSDPGQIPECRWTTTDSTVSLRVYPGITLGGLRPRSPAPYVDTTLAGRPALVWRLASGCWAAAEAGSGVVLAIAEGPRAPEGTICPEPVRTVEHAVDNITGRRTRIETQNLDVLANTPCSAGTRIPLASIVGPGTEPDARRLDSGDLSCRWEGVDGRLTFVTVPATTADPLPGAQPTRVGDRSAFEIRHPGVCSVEVLADGRALLFAVVATPSAPRPDCESAHLAMQTLLGA